MPCKENGTAIELSNVSPANAVILPYTFWVLSNRWYKEDLEQHITVDHGGPLQDDSLDVPNAH